jgi:hypothetical protein
MAHGLAVSHSEPLCFTSVKRAAHSLHSRGWIAATDRERLLRRYKPEGPLKGVLPSFSVAEFAYCLRAGAT